MPYAQTNITFMFDDMLDFELVLLKATRDMGVTRLHYLSCVYLYSQRR